MPKAYVSATFADLKEFRHRASVALKRAGYDDVAMEYYVAEDRPSVDKCLADVAACDLYIGIFAWRYGWIPPGRDVSITELEYRHAVELKKPRFFFVLDEDAPWPGKQIDDDRRPIRALRERVQADRMAALFTDINHFDAQLSAALLNHSPAMRTTPGVDTAAYFKFLRNRYKTLDLDALTDPKRDDFVPLGLQSVYVEQHVKEDAPPIELPKETLQLLLSRNDVHADDFGLTAEEGSALRSAFAERASRPALDVLASEGAARAIVLGDPGAGKSTLLRYIVLSLIGDEPRLGGALAGR